MAYNFLRGDPDQPFLLPPDLRDWLPADHLAWFVLDVVDQLDLAPFLRAYRADGHGHPAYDPTTLLGVLLYAYAIGVRSSRQIERCCHEDLAFRVLAGNQVPDHVTISRFRVRHQQALAGFLVASLQLCAAAGLVRLGVVALDGTKVAANAANRANRTLAKLQTEVAQMLREAAETDQAEDRLYGRARGDELPAELANPSGRLARLQQAKALLEAEAAERQRRYQQRVVDLAAAARARGSKPRAHIKPRRRDEAPKPGAVANTTDPDSRLVPTRNGTVQGYNAQAVVTEHQILVAAALTQQANDLQQLAPMLAAVDQTLAAADIDQRPGRLLADAGYWSIANLTAIPNAPELLIPPAKHGRQGKPRKDGKPSESKSDGLRAAMAAKLASDRGKVCYAKRKETVEPVFGQLKQQQDARRFTRRSLAACDAEWKLLCGTHNLLKLWRHTPQSTGTQPDRRLSSGHRRLALCADRLPRRTARPANPDPGPCGAQRAGRSNRAKPFRQHAVSGQPSAECWSRPRRRRPVGLACPAAGWVGSPAASSQPAPKPNAPSGSPSGWAASGTGETPSSAGPFFRRVIFVTEPRDLTDLVPAEVRVELAAAVAALELHGPAVTKALRRLDRATTAAWNAVNPVDPTQDEWRLVERAVGIDRGWNAAYQLVSTLDPPGQGRSPT